MAVMRQRVTTTMTAPRRSCLGALGMLLTMCAACKCERGSDAPAPLGDRGAPPVELTENTSMKQEIEQVTARLAEARKGHRAVAYAVPDEATAARFATWVTGQAGGRDTPFEGYTRSALDHGDLVFLREAPGARRGGPMVLLRPGPARGLLIELPHTFFDTGTRTIGAVVFGLVQARALLANTVSRYAKPSSHDPEAFVSDVAHEPRSLFHSAHEALLAAEPHLVTVQLHGFTPSPDRDFDVVVSAAGTALDVGPVADRLTAALAPARVRRYPGQVRQLGGTTNVQARHAAQHGRGFVHIELSRELRERLRTDRDLARRFAGALAPLGAAR